MESNKYKKALEEIKSLLPAQNCKSACFSCPENGQCEELFAKPIRRIIDKVLCKKVN